MKIVLLSGGSGKRLWPLSNGSRSKQFLRILKDEDFKLQSMLQRIWNQLKRSGLSDSTIIATNKSQEDIIANQLSGQAKLILEPSRRDTFPAILLAAVHLLNVAHVGLDEVIAVLPVDSFVGDEFFEQVKELEVAVRSSNTDIALMGVHPVFPSEKYGYIVPNRNEEISGNNYLIVKNFYEKPSEGKAKELIAQHALWNCGVFAFQLGYLIEFMKKMGLPTEYETLIEQYDQLEKISFDYAVVKRTQKIIVLPYSGFWKDLGTWNTLIEEMGVKQIGNGIISNDSFNTHLINELDLPVTVLGISNTIVVASSDGILVSDIGQSPKVKEFIKDFDDRPMYVERNWGWYRVLDYTKSPIGNESLTKRIVINAGKNLSYQLHKNRDEIWTIINGEGLLVLGDEFSHIKVGDVVKIPAGVQHSVKALNELEFIEVQCGNELTEDDVFRILVTWEEIEGFCKKKYS